MNEMFRGVNAQMNKAKTEVKGYVASRKIEKAVKDGKVGENLGESLGQLAAGLSYISTTIHQVANNVQENPKPLNDALMRIVKKHKQPVGKVVCAGIDLGKAYVKFLDQYLAIIDEVGETVEEEGTKLYKQYAEKDFTKLGELLEKLG